MKLKRQFLIGLIGICIACPLRAQGNLGQPEHTDTAFQIENMGHQLAPHSLRQRSRGCDGGKAAVAASIGGLVGVLIMPFLGALVIGAAAAGAACLFDDSTGT